MLSWRYWPNVGCYEFSFERTVFFELSTGAVSLPNSGSELGKLLNLLFEKCNIMVIQNILNIFTFSYHCQHHHHPGIGRGASVPTSRVRLHTELHHQFSTRVRQISQKIPRLNVIKLIVTTIIFRCIQACNATSYGYVGLMNGNTCVCVNEQPMAKVADSRCNIACSGDSDFTCGGTWTMNVLQYPADHSSGLTYLGCFKNSFDDLDRILEGGTFNNFRNNTPDW